MLHAALLTFFSTVKHPDMRNSSIYHGLSQLTAQMHEVTLNDVMYQANLCRSKKPVVSRVY